VSPAVWFDGNQQAYSDLAGAVPVSTGLIRRINEPSPLAGAWTSPTDAERPIRDSNSVRLECIGTPGGYEMTRPAVGGLVLNACTLVFSFVARDCVNGSPGMGLVRTDDTVIGLIATGTLWVYYGGTIWFTTLAIAPGAKNTIVIRYSPTGIEASLLANGVTTTQSLAVSLPATAIAGAWRLGVAGTAYLYGSVTQTFAVARTVDATERDALLAWTHAQVAPAAYPDDRALITYVGDSITRGVAASTNLTYPFRVLDSIRSTKPLTENCVTATPGISATGLILAGAGTTYYESNRQYSASRVKNIMVVALGSNDLAGTNSSAFFLHGTAPPSTPGSGIYPLCDDARSRGWKVVLIGVPPRSGSLGITQLEYNTKRAEANTDMAANWAAHADAFVDVRGITNYGADGDSNNTTYYADLVHPNNAGHGLLAPYVAAAVLSLL
jgi:lysophospholipase L1-like esterase